MKPTKETIIRTIVYFVALVNMTLTMFGKNPLPFESVDVEQFFAVALDVVAGLVAWWKNNSFTAPAILSDSYMRTDKKIKKETGESNYDMAMELTNGKENVNE